MRAQQTQQQQRQQRQQQQQHTHTHTHTHAHRCGAMRFAGRMACTTPTTRLLKFARGLPWGFTHTEVVPVVGGGAATSKPQYSLTSCAARTQGMRWSTSAWVFSSDEVRSTALDSWSPMACQPGACTNSYMRVRVSICSALGTDEPQRRPLQRHACLPSRAVASGRGGQSAPDKVARVTPRRSSMSKAVGPACATSCRSRSSCPLARAVHRSNQAHTDRTKHEATCHEPQKKRKHASEHTSTQNEHTSRNSTRLRSIGHCRNGSSPPNPWTE
jgi:hypothetical protein